MSTDLEILIEDFKLLLEKHSLEIIICKPHFIGGNPGAVIKTKDENKETHIYEDMQTICEFLQNN